MVQESVRLERDFVKPAGGHVEDESAQGFVFRDERTGVDAAQRLTHVFFEIGERLGGPLRFDTGLVLDGALELVAVKVSIRNRCGGSG